MDQGFDLIVPGERRIRVHTVAAPIAKTLQDVYDSVDTDAVAALLAKLGLCCLIYLISVNTERVAVDKTLSSKMQDARDSLLNAVNDALSTYKAEILGNPSQMASIGLLAPRSLYLLPLYILGLLKSVRDYSILF